MPRAIELFRLVSQKQWRAGENGVGNRMHGTLTAVAARIFGAHVGWATSHLA